MTVAVDKTLSGTKVADRNGCKRSYLTVGNSVGFKPVLAPICVTVENGTRSGSSLIDKMEVCLKQVKFVIPMVSLALSILTGSPAKADQKQSSNMIHSHTYDIGNSIGGVANNFNIKETYFVDAKSICRHIGLMTAAARAIDNTLFWDKELKQTAAGLGRMNESLALLISQIRNTRNFCGRDYAAEGSFDPKKEGNKEFIKAAMKQIAEAYSTFSAEFKKVDGYLEEKARLEK